MENNTNTNYIQSDKEFNKMICSRWASLNQRCVNGKYAESFPHSRQFQSYRSKNITLDLTFDEFFDWFYLMRGVHESIIKSGDKSSIDRIDESKGYSIDNIRLISLHENIENRFKKVCGKTPDSKKEAISRRNRRVYDKNKELEDN